MLGTTRQSGYSIGPSDPFVDRPTTQVGSSGIPEATCDRPSAEGSHKDSWPPEPHNVYHDKGNSGDEPKTSHVTELVWHARAKFSACSHLHLAQKGKVKFTFNVVKHDKIFDVFLKNGVVKCDKIFDVLLKNGNIKLSYSIAPIEELKKAYIL
jgi:hypothetical protein